MLEEIFNLIKGNASESVINNPAVPDEQNDAVVAEATNTVASGLRNIVAGGGLQNLLAMFSGGQKQGSGLLSNPIVNMMVGHFAGKLMSKFNMGGGQANQVATSLIPSVIGSLINKTNEGSNGFSLEGLLNSITGGQVTQQQQSGINLQDIISQLGGGQQSSQGSAGGGLADIFARFAEGAQQQQQRNGGGGLMDLIEGFIKK